MTVLDRAFSIELSARYATAPDLVSALERAMRSDQEGGAGLEDLLAQVDEIVAARGLPVLSERRESLERCMSTIVSVANKFATTHGLEYVDMARAVKVTATEASYEKSLATIVHGERPIRSAAYRVDHRGANEYTMSVDAEEVWRGSSVDESFTTAVKEAVASQFLAAHRTSPEIDGGMPGSYST
ncbi:hypothetical protein PJI18_09940 [Mycobacterium kansasii]